MLVEFRVKNFRSIRQEQSFSFVAAKDKSLQDTHCIKIDHAATPNLTRSAVVYGPNASGKSNLIFALMTMQNLVLNSTRLLEQQFQDQYTPFLLDDYSKHEPTEFEITLLIDGVRYQYGFAFNADKVQAEWLLVYKSSKPQRWFEYHHNPESNENEWEPFSSYFKGHKETWKSNTAPRSLFLTQASQSNSLQLMTIFDWFANYLIVIPARAELNLEPTLARLEDPHYKKQVLELMNAADIHISDLKVERKKGQQLQFKFQPGKPPQMTSTIDGELSDITFCHPTEEGESVWFDRRYESFGTQRLLGYAGPMLDALENGKLLVVDEFDTSLHPLLTRYILQLMHNPAISKNGAQLWMTTHDTSLLKPDLLRRDQIWFVEKDDNQASHLYSLTEYAPRKNEALERGYLMGRYGAIPFLTDLFFADQSDAG